MANYSQLAVGPIKVLAHVFHEPSGQASHCLLAQDPENQELVRFYMHTMKTIGQRLVLKLAPSIKRNICKTCNSLLVPGVTSTIRHRGECNSVLANPSWVQTGTVLLACLAHTPASLNTEQFTFCIPLIGRIWIQT
uniref:Ribonuclease P 21 subunit n=1 Tax=Eptatretus burgeri TaxID=7764 RepID=A0A8C4QW06_EPTBU